MLTNFYQFAQVLILLYFHFRFAPGHPRGNLDFLFIWILCNVHCINQNFAAQSCFYWWLAQLPQPLYWGVFDLLCWTLAVLLLLLCWRTVLFFYWWLIRVNLVVFAPKFWAHVSLPWGEIGSETGGETGSKTEGKTRGITGS